MKDLPPHLIQLVQRHTGTPWWNGEAYAEHVGYPQRIWRAKTACQLAADDLRDVINALRSEQNFTMSDRLRTIADRLQKEAE